MPETSTVASITGVIGELRTTPVLLLIVLLNMIFIMASTYIVVTEEGNRADDRKEMMHLVERCALQTIPLEYAVKPSRERP